MGTRNATAPEGGVIVLGMHRAGTSLVSSLLVRLGYEVPGEAVPRDLDNRRGYFEPREIVELHDELLHGLGRSWGDRRPMAAGALGNGGVEATVARIREVVRREMAGRRRWVLKDPRMCRLIPLWKPILVAEGLPFRILHVVRSPLAVAESLRVRNGFGRAKSLLLWLRHNLEAEAATRGEARNFLRFEEIVAAGTQPTERLRETCADLGIGWDRARKAIDEIVDPSLIHQPPGNESGLGTYPWVEEAYAALIRPGGVDDVYLDRLREEVAAADRLFFVDSDGLPEDDTIGSRVWLHREVLRHRAAAEAQRLELEAQRQELRQVLDLWDREGLRGRPRRVAALEDLTRDSADRHLTILGKSLEVLREVDARLAATTNELADALRQRDEAAERARDLAGRLGEVSRQRDEEARLRVRHEVELALAQASLEGSQAELGQLLRRRSWRYTAPLRSVVVGLKVLLGRR